MLAGHENGPNTNAITSAVRSQSATVRNPAAKIASAIFSIVLGSAISQRSLSSIIRMRTLRSVSTFSYINVHCVHSLTSRSWCLLEGFEPTWMSVEPNLIKFSDTSIATRRRIVELDANNARGVEGQHRSVFLASGMMDAISCLEHHFCSPFVNETALNGTPSPARAAR